MSEALTAAQTSTPGTSPSSATAAGVTSASRVLPGRAPRPPRRVRRRRAVPARRSGPARRCAASPPAGPGTRRRRPAGTPRTPLPRAAPAAVTVPPPGSSTCGADGPAGQQVEPDQPSHVVGPRLPGDVGGPARLHHPPVLDHHQPVAEHRGVHRVVGDHHGRAGEPGQMAAQLGPDLQPGPGVQRGQRLVQQQQRRLGGQRPGQRHALRLPTGDRPGPRPRQVGDPDPLQPAPSPAGGPPAGVRRGPADRTRRCPARSGGGTAGSPGTPRRPVARAAARGRRGPGRPARCRRPRSGRRPGRAARPGPAARWTSPRRWVRAAPRPRPARRPGPAPG